jgi:hypothetical protein
MAYKIGLVGLTNTGKSYSRRTIKKGEEVFILSPSQKALHIKDSNGNPLRPLNIKTKISDNINQVAEKLGLHKFALAKKLLAVDADIEISGNYLIMNDIKYLEDWLKFIDRKMPHIKILILPDFTHYISEVISQKEFIQRKSGGDAFQRFWELAGDLLNSYITSIDLLREDLMVISEYHAEFNEANQVYEIFVPGGKMLKEKFLPDSYYDFLLYTHVMDDDSSLKQNDRYKFVTRRTEKYNARCLDLFDEPFVPNDLQSVIDKVNDYLGNNTQTNN